MVVNIVFTLICIYLVWFVSYLFTVELGRHYFRAVNKVILASIYLALAFIAFFTSDADKSLTAILLVALIFTCVGDIVLMFHFMIGAGFFTLGNVMVFVYQIMLCVRNNIAFSKIWYFILIFFGVLAISATYFKKSKTMEFKGNKYILALGYLFFVTLHGAFSSVLVFTYKQPFMLLLSLGSILFMTSDHILAKYSFSKVPLMYDQRLNTTSYFMGILLIALSMFII